MVSKFAQLRREGGNKILMLLWRYVFRHTELRDREFAQVSHLAQGRSGQYQSAQGPGTMHDHLLHTVQLQQTQGPVATGAQSPNHSAAM
jgi:hypothetical protein